MEEAERINYTGRLQWKPTPWCFRILHINVWIFDFSFDLVVAPYQQVREVNSSTWALVGEVLGQWHLG